jgi:hypothetical protein
MIRISRSATSSILCNLRRPPTSAHTGLPREPGPDEVANATMGCHTGPACDFSRFLGRPKVSQCDVITRASQLDRGFDGHRRAGRRFSDLACGTGGHRIRTVPARGLPWAWSMRVCLGACTVWAGMPGLGLDPIQLCAWVRGFSLSLHCLGHRARGGSCLGRVSERESSFNREPARRVGRIEGFVSSPVCRPLDGHAN